MRFLLLGLLCIPVVGRSAEAADASTPTKSVVDFVMSMPSHRWAYKWTLRHFEELNIALERFVSRERPGNSKILIVPQTYGYAVAWIRSDWEEPFSEAEKKKAGAIVDSYLWGSDYARIAKEIDEEKRPNQASEPTAPSGRGSP
jgi:hypothetical protein